MIREVRLRGTSIYSTLYTVYIYTPALVVCPRVFHSLSLAVYELLCDEQLSLMHLCCIVYDTLRCAFFSGVSYVGRLIARGHDAGIGFQSSFGIIVYADAWNGRVYGFIALQERQRIAVGVLFVSVNLNLRVARNFGC